ncbi:uncharacterized protein EV154DRAFT_508756 [Mucor mucedo]|uniref:uncharacterized protein n=1 Tax=Mucor mucedo TaxID=29922 RepID=UPI00221F4C9D|nr:uncharacterized protein EV154DRAFT_508756 [Mucor mucedo]KAI7891329.1 hypothetical protein EV154DRAFT_508756 [Mucor mucedo]
MANNHLHYRPPNLLELPLELLLKISEYLSFADLWYLATGSRHCRALSHQIIWHRYRIDLSRPQLNAFNHIVHAALAYISRHGYNKNNAIDQTIIQSVSNRLAVEIYDRSPLKNWEPCLDFFLDKTLGIILDHVFLDPLLDTTTSAILDQPTITNLSKNQHLLVTEFYPTRTGRLMTNFLTTLYPTMIALFETEPTTEIHHRLLLNHINRHLDSLSSRYHNHHRRRLLLNTSPRSTRVTALAAVQQHNQFLRLNFRILIRFIGTLVQTDLLSANDLDIITRQRIQFFFLTFQQVVHTNDDIAGDPQKRKFKRSEQQPQQQYQQILFYNSLKSKNSYCWQMWLEEIEFQMEIFLDLRRAVLLSQQGDPITDDLSTVSTMLDNTVSALISTRSNDNQLPIILSPSTSTV